MSRSLTAHVARMLSFARPFSGRRTTLAKAFVPRCEATSYALKFFRIKTRGRDWRIASIPLRNTSSTDALLLLISEFLPDDAQSC